MLEALKFVQGAVASKGFAPELTHFCIRDGYVKGFNGSLALSSPIELDIEATPKAVPFIKAIQACRGETALHLSKAGRLGIKSGKFKAFINCIDQEYPDVEPEGEKVEISGSFVKHLRMIIPFVAEDASRPWSRGILLEGKTATATNNIIILQKWLSEPFPIRVNLPLAAARELVRIKEEPTHFSLTENTISFYYEDGRWLRTNLIDQPWPDISPILERPAEVASFPEGFFQSVEDVIPFLDEANTLRFKDGVMKTSEEEGDGASVEYPEITENFAFNGKQLLKLAGVADTIDFSLYPAPCLFFGDSLRGAIVGMRIE